MKLCILYLKVEFNSHIKKKVLTICCTIWIYDITFKISTKCYFCRLTPKIKVILSIKFVTIIFKGNA